jgi:hypothetical protein
MLLALPLCVASATMDDWADPFGEHLLTQDASPVWSLLLVVAKTLQPSGISTSSRHPIAIGKDAESFTIRRPLFAEERR